MYHSIPNMVPDDILKVSENLRSGTYIFPALCKSAWIAILVKMGPIIKGCTEACRANIMELMCQKYKREVYQQIEILICIISSCAGTEMAIA